MFYFFFLSLSPSRSLQLNIENEYGNALLCERNLSRRCVQNGFEFYISYSVKVIAVFSPLLFEIIIRDCKTMVFFSRLHEVKCASNV